MIITRDHLRTVTGFGPRPGLCARGSRAWFQQHGLSWDDFLRNGVDEETLLATGDAFAVEVVRQAHGQQ